MVGQPDPLFVPSVMKTLTPLTNDPAPEEDLFQRYQEREQDKLSKFCTDAGFLNVVQIG